MSPAELPYRAARLIAAHVESIAPRRRSIPSPHRGPWPTRWVHVPEGIDAALYVAAAERSVAGGLEAFGASGANGGAPQRCNCDPKTGTQARLPAGTPLNHRARRVAGAS